MAIAQSVHDHLAHAGVRYDLIGHSATFDSQHSAQAAHVPGDQLAKGIVLKDEQGFLMAVVPATHRVDLRALHRLLDRPLGLATEPEAAQIFADCTPGAIPALGAPYGLEAIFDDSLLGVEDVYFEAGDHQQLVHLSGDAFQDLMAGVPHARISHHV